MSANIINMDEALERIGGDKEFLYDMLNEFVRQVDEKLPALGKAVNEKDFDNIKIIAHSLRGAAVNLSINDMHRALSDIEALIPPQDIDKMAVILKEINGMQADLRFFLEQQE